MPFVVSGLMCDNIIIDGMKEGLNTDLCTRIFKTAGIEPTPARIALLTIIFQLNKKTFRTNDVSAEVTRNKLPIGNSTVITTIKLFQVRGIIKQIYPLMINEKAGRPSAVFVLSVSAHDS